MLEKKVSQVPITNFKKEPMTNGKIDALNQILTNTLSYRNYLKKLAASMQHEATQDKLMDFSKVADKESKELIQIISELGGDVETTSRQTDDEAICWINPHFSNTNMLALVSELINVERRRESAYSDFFSDYEISRETRNRLRSHRLEAENNLLYLQTTKEALEKKN